MEIRKSNQKLEMKKAPKTEIEILKEKIDTFDKKLDKIIKIIKSNSK